MFGGLTSTCLMSAYEGRFTQTPLALLTLLGGNLKQDGLIFPPCLVYVCRN